MKIGHSANKVVDPVHAATKIDGSRKPGYYYWDCVDLERHGHSSHCRGVELATSSLDAESTSGRVS